jgi:cation diffusion facilitator family transporter
VTESAAGAGSRFTVLVALAINLVIAAAKGSAALLTGSSALLAESAHSVADTGNEAFLLVALRRSQRPADQSHPFGYGAERFYWSLLAAIGIFVAGGVAAIYEGIRNLGHPEPLVRPLIAYGVLVVSLALEATSWITAYRQVRGESRGRGLPLGAYLRRTTDPTATTVFYEDSAAVIGIGFALVGVALHQLTGSAVPDALASIAIGVLLVLVAVRLASRERELLTNQSASPAIVAAIRRRLESSPGVRAVPRLEVLVIGPRTVLVTGEIDVEEAAEDGAGAPGDGGGVTALMASLRDQLRAQPGVAEVYLTPVTTAGPRSQERGNPDPV